jgi:hypothetical protein
MLAIAANKKGLMNQIIARPIVAELTEKNLMQTIDHLPLQCLNDATANVYPPVT